MKEKDTCFKGCPYEIEKSLEPPHKNNKLYSQFKEEYLIQKEASYFKNILDEEIEKYIYGELSESEYNNLVSKIAKNKDFYVAHHQKSYSKLLCDVYNLKIRLESNSIENAERIVYDVGDYFCFKTYKLYSINDKNGNSLWDKEVWGCNWILKSKFNNYFWNKMKDNLTDNITLKRIEHQLEEYYGLITILKLSE